MVDQNTGVPIGTGRAVGRYFAQILSGAANVWTRLRPWAVVMHVALSVLIWSTLVALATLARMRSGDAIGETTGDNLRPEAGRGDLHLLRGEQQIVEAEGGVSE